VTLSAGRITLWGVEVFVATAEEGSLSAAAHRLDISTATVSQQLTNLESAVGTALLHRGERPVTLTPAGAMFLARANVILNEADQARTELAMADLSRLTRFRIGMIEDLDADVTPRLLSALATSMPACRFLLETGASHRLHDALEARALDLVVAAEGTPGPGIEVHPLLADPFVALVPQGADAGATDSLPLIQYTTRHLMGRQIAAHLARAGLRPSPRFELDSYTAILAMVASGAGWTIMTPMGWLSAARFRDAVDLRPLPIAPFARQITLTARVGSMGDMPGQVAGQLRGLLQDWVGAPVVARHPWLSDSLLVQAA
jgi:DNA-binding transcriptional LysR family regulator